jgi:hypothetical protein
MRVPPGREVDLRSFRSWFDRHRQAVRTLGDIDAHALFEEFRGVIGAQPGGPLGLADYLALGPRQSLMPASAREAAHNLFQRYRQWLTEAGLFDAALVAHEWRVLAAPEYDFVVVDEGQDLTPVQLALVLATLKSPGQFLLCGDSNQIVHPNFFSWATVKTMFWHGLAGAAAQHQQLHVLQANVRNTRRVTELANRLLKVKQSRFGSVDRESNFLVTSTSGEEGEVALVPAREAAVKALDAATRASAQHAVVVLCDEDKAAAREQFRTPLPFSVHEAKGLEYPHVVLVNLVSGQRVAYAEVYEGVTATDVQRKTLEYARAGQVRPLAGGIQVLRQRAVLGDNARGALAHAGGRRHGPRAAGAAGLQRGEVRLQPARASTKDEWAQKARKLELQGKAEQAQAIREAFLQHRPVPWAPWDQAHIEQFAVKAFDAASPSTKPRQAILDYALWHGQQHWIEQLAAVNFPAARSLVVDGEFLGAGWHDSRDVRVPLWEQGEMLVRRTVAASTP